MSQDSTGMADIGAIYQRLGQGLVDTAPPGWASIGLGAAFYQDGKGAWLTMTCTILDRAASA